MDGREEGLEARMLDASDPPDPDPSGFATDAADREQGDSAAPNPVWLPEGLTEHELLEWARKRKKAHEAWFGDNNGYNEKILDWWKAYDNKMIAGQSNTNSVPISNSIIETDTAKTYQAVMSRAKVVDAVPKSPQQDNENKETVTDLINQELLASESRTGEKLFATIKALKIEGTGIGRASWEECWIETIPDMREPDPLTGQMVMTKPVKEVKQFKKTHRPDWNSPPIQNCIFDHRVDRAQDSTFFCEKQFPTTVELLVMQEEGKITDISEILKQPTSTEEAQKNLDEKRKRQLAPSGNGPMEVGQHTDERELDEWFALVPFKAPDPENPDDRAKWTKQWLHFFIVNDEKLVMCEPDPFVDELGRGPGHPYFSFHQCVIPRSFLGKSVHAPIMDTQVYINNLSSSTQKLVNKAARNPTFVSRAAGLDTMRLFYDELAVIPVQDASQVKYNPIDGASIKAVSEERAWAINMARETVAANEQAQGVPTTTLGNATATEASIINANSGTRFQLIVDQFNYEFFGALANLYFWMIRQWAQDNEMVVRESSVDGMARPVTRADLEDDYFFTPITSAIVNDQRAALQVEMQFAQQMQQLQATNPAALTDSSGKQYRFDLFDFLVQEIMPKMNIRNGRSFMKEVSPIGMMGAPGLPGGAPPGLPPGQGGAQPGSLGGGKPTPNLVPRGTQTNHGVPTAPPRPELPGPPVAPQPGFASVALHA